jgi:hypothetical protein
MTKSKRSAKNVPGPRAAPPPEAADSDNEIAELRAVFADLIHRRQRAFLAGFVVAKGVNGAERLSGVRRWSHYNWMREDPLYCERFELAKTMLADDAEEEILRRALFGADTPVVYRGEITAWYKSYSDALMIFALKALKPEVYRAGRRPGLDFAGPCQFEVTIEKPKEASSERQAASATGAQSIAPGSTPSEATRSVRPPCQGGDEERLREPSDYERRALDLLRRKL